MTLADELKAERDRPLIDDAPGYSSAQKADLSDLAMGHLSHRDMANTVRMLMRTDYMHENVVAAARDRIAWLAGDNEQLRNGIAQVCDGLERGDIGEDVTWFNLHTTLWEFCAELIGREEPLGDALPQPSPIDRQYMQLLKDAERYRWLRTRDLDTVHTGGVFAGKTPDNVVLSEEDLDAAIDSAMTSDIQSKEKADG